MAERKSASAADFVARIVKDPANPPQTTLLTGYAGASSEAGHTRLYFDPGLSNYVEIPDDAILHRQDVDDPGGLGGVHLWVRRDAELIAGPAGSQRPKGKFLEGPIMQAAAGAGAAAGAHPVTLLPPCGPRPTLPAQCRSDFVACQTWICTPVCLTPHCPPTPLCPITPHCPIQTGFVCPPVTLECPVQTALCGGGGPLAGGGPVAAAAAAAAVTVPPQACMTPPLTPVLHCPPTPHQPCLSHVPCPSVPCPTLHCLSQAPCPSVPCPSLHLPCATPPASLPACPAAVNAPVTSPPQVCMTPPQTPVFPCPQTLLGCPTHAPFVCPTPPQTPVIACPQTLLGCPTHAPFLCPTPPAVCASAHIGCPTLLGCPTHAPFMCPQTLLGCPTHAPFLCPNTLAQCPSQPVLCPFGG